MLSSPSPNKSQLRRLCRAQLRDVSAESSQHAGKQLCATLANDPVITSSQHIACYSPLPGEIVTQPLIDELQRSGKTIYQPISRRCVPYLLFREQRPEDRGVTRGFSIQEPTEGPFIASHDLDVVIIPVLAVSPEGIRLGRGMGYFDRTFARADPHRKKIPYLIAVAYEWQLRDSVKADPWDIAMDRVIVL